MIKCFFLYIISLNIRFIFIENILISTSSQINIYVSQP